MPSLFTTLAGTPNETRFDCRPKPTCDPRPVCPACGGLECLCRPRFFAGQLLTDEDLNRLDHYIVAKNRLHNRHLFGWGVACGLEVVCSICEPAGGGSHVVVKPGYALSPCGNDIVVCKEQSVDVCDLINRCRPRLPDECFEPNAARSTDCLHGTEQWVLAICYSETPSRGVTALRGASGASCGCGGSCANPGCSCGGMSGGAANGAKAKSVSPRKLPAQCEPTLTCEGYTFAVYRVPVKKTREIEYGALVRRFLCCVQGLFEQLAELPSGDSQEERLQWLIDLKNAVRDFLVTEGLYDCDLAEKLSAMSVPSAGQADAAKFMTDWQAATFDILETVVAVLRKCLCAALLPPCPDPEMADCVPIATLTVDRGKCRVRRVCNLSQRRFLTTFPTLEYWLSWLPMFQQWTGGRAGTTLRDIVEKMCCPPIKDTMEPVRKSVNIREPKATVRPAASMRAEARSPQGEAGDAEHPFASLLGEALARRDAPVNAATLLLAAMGATDMKGGALLSSLALEHPAEALLTHQVVAPMFAAMFPGAAMMRRPAAADTNDVSDLKQTVTDLKRQLGEHQMRLDRLSEG
jgi:hypothetical protein